VSDIPAGTEISLTFFYSVVDERNIIGPPVHCKSSGSRIDTCYTKIVFDTDMNNFCICSPTI